MSILEPYQGKYVSAKSAANDINIGEIFAACDEIDSNVSELDNLANEFNSAGECLDTKALSVDGATMMGLANDCGNNMKSAKSTILDYTAQVREVASARYNEIQQEYNDQAKLLDNSLQEGKGE